MVNCKVVYKSNAETINYESSVDHVDDVTNNEHQSTAVIRVDYSNPEQLRSVKIIASGHR